MERQLVWGEYEYRNQLSHQSEEQKARMSLSVISDLGNKLKTNINSNVM
jgi:hypothetical protein